MIRKLLIANRGEIACRIIKTAKKLGIATVAVYSDADQHAQHVQMADDAVYIGGAPSKESYLNMSRIVDAVKQTGADGVHPGYGFLSENAVFARALAQENVLFIGPPASAIEAMGSKSAAKQIMEEAGVPLVPGYHGHEQDEAYLQDVANKMGYPVLLKAAAGGGGKGMRQVWAAQAFPQALAAAKREALTSFGDDIMLVEKYLTAPRHVEIQVFCDSHGNGVYLFERDCSIQRRHQKVIEEAPAPGMSDALRQGMGEAALKAAHAIGYVGAGTVEFLLDSDGSYYFMEMNTRLQVEHPVTEMITGEDLVEWQIRVAEGNGLPKQQHQLTLFGHAFEARIYAEDPANEFLPATGKLAFLRPPQESRYVRVDTGVVQGDEVSVYYDPMIAKLIVWGENREEALRRLVNALGEYYIDGVTTNIPFLHKIAASDPFKQAKLSTTFIETHSNTLFPETSGLPVHLLPAMAMLIVQSRKKGDAEFIDKNSPWALNSRWRLNSTYKRKVTLAHGKDTFDIQLELQPHPSAKESATWQVQYQQHRWQVSALVQGHELQIDIDGHQQRFVWSGGQTQFTLFTATGNVVFELVLPDLGDTDGHQAETGFEAPMNGTIVAVVVEPGQPVKKGDTLLIMEAMKMEHNMTAPTDGQVMAVYYQAGDLVDGGKPLLEFKAHDA